MTHIQAASMALPTNTATPGYAKESPLCTAGRGYLARATVAIGANTMLPLVIGKLPKSIKAKDWRLRRASFISLELVAGECGRMPKGHGDMLFDMCMQVFFHSKVKALVCTVYRQGPV